jgi:predicted acetyltransferase
MDTRIRPWTAEEQPDVVNALERAFLSDVDPAAPEPLGMMEHDRTLSVWDDGAPVATAAAFSLRMTVPGGVTPVAGVTLVSVQPTHRRRGLLGSLMRSQLAELAASREPVAALWASEPAIYGRYGYGLASRSASARLSRGARLRPGLAADLPVREAAPGEVGAELSRAWDAWQATRPGEYARTEGWWEHALFDPASHREGHTALRCALLPDGAGYALFATKGGFDEFGAAGRVRVRELVARDAGARLRLWEFLLGLDLVGEVHARLLALDDALLAALVDVRRAGPRLHDGLYVRPTRVGDALTSRAYAADLDVVLEVVDDLLPDNAGRWRLRAGADGASCERTGDAPDLTVPVETLGAAYLGGTTLLSLLAAGRGEEHTDGAARAASRAFRGDVEPLCSHVF